MSYRLKHKPKFRWHKILPKVIKAGVNLNFCERCVGRIRQKSHQQIGHRHVIFTYNLVITSDIDYGKSEDWIICRQNSKNCSKFYTTKNFVVFQISLRLSIDCRFITKTKLQFLFRDLLNVFCCCFAPIGGTAFAYPFWLNNFYF